jgi:hypothetical protein
MVDTCVLREELSSFWAILAKMMRHCYNVVRFASSLRLDYLSFTLPFLITGTPLFERLNGDVPTNTRNITKFNFLNKSYCFDLDFQSLS